MQTTILLIEDEPALQMTVGDRLRSKGYETEYADDGNVGLQKATSRAFDVIILDIMLPGKDGFAVCSEIRKAGIVTPILMLTARGQMRDKVRGLKIGADDYLTKPFHMAELIARVEALLRRTVKTEPASPLDAFGTIRIDRRGTAVTRDGKPVDLSAREFELLTYFLDHPGATLSREELIRQVWGYSTDTLTRTIDVHVAGLRQKLEVDPREPRYIVTVPRLGYKFTP